MIETNFGKAFFLLEGFKQSWEFITKYPKETLFPLAFYAIMGVFSFITSFVLRIPFDKPVKLEDFLKTGIEKFEFNTQTIVIIVIVSLFILMTFLIYENIDYYCIRIGINWFSNQEEPHIARDLKIDYRLFGRFLLLSLVYGLIIIGGVLLFIIPGIIWGMIYFFSTRYFIMHRSSIKESLTGSSKLTYGVKWQLFGTTLLVGIISSLFRDSDNIRVNLILGIITSFISVFMSYAYTYLFIDLHQQTFSDTEDESSDPWGSIAHEIPDSPPQNEAEP